MDGMGERLPRRARPVLSASPRPPLPQIPILRRCQEPSTQLRFEDVYESFRVASPASLFQQQESGPGHPTIDISGRRCLESFERLAPPMSWRRTFAASLVGMTGWFSTRCALTWKVKATKSSRSYFLLQASTRRTAGTESGLLPTVTATDNKGGGNGETDYQKKHAFDKLKYCASTGMLPTQRRGTATRRPATPAEEPQLSGTRWERFPTVAPVCGGDDGLSQRLDGITFPKWRRESIKAYGNAIVPQVAYQIFQALHE